MILAGDIGGTKVNLGLFEVPDRRLKLVRDGRFLSREHAGLENILREFLAAAPPAKIDQACFGVAGPVRNGEAQATNLPWRVIAAKLADELKLKSVSLINDLEANGYGLAELSPSDFCVLSEGARGATGNAAVISAGTGLGEAGLYWDGRKHHPFACEGGHADFAPRTKLDAELFEYLRGRFGRVSCERVLSGSGLFHVYEFLRDTRRGEEPASLADELKTGDPAAIISRAAANGESSRCAQALDLFTGHYGAEAGNLALKLMATGGVYVGGGIAPKILAQIQKGIFLEAFRDKPPLRSLLEAMPVRVILNPATALLGAAHYAAHGPEGFGKP